MTQRTEITIDDPTHAQRVWEAWTKEHPAVIDGVDTCYMINRAGKNYILPADCTDPWNKVADPLDDAWEQWWPTDAKADALSIYVVDYNHPSGVIATIAPATPAQSFEYFMRSGTAPEDISKLWEAYRSTFTKSQIDRVTKILKHLGM